MAEGERWSFGKAVAVREAAAGRRPKGRAERVTEQIVGTKILFL